MKNVYVTLLLMMVSFAGMAQVPGGINYQVVIRDVDGKVLSNENVTISATITDGAGNAYSESISALSDAFGVVNTIIGTQDTEGELNDLDWGAGNATLSVNVSSESGSVDMGTTQLLSVPFAFYAANSGSSKEGPQGEQGPEGPAGPEGPQGPQGEPGQDGTGVAIVGTLPSPNDLPNPYSGEVGDMYIIQESGEGYVWDGSLWNPVGQIQGPAGPQGPQGNQGPQGDEGPVGPAGPQGEEGQVGPEGPEGPQGPIGQIGPQGIQGDEGPEGPEGPQGPIGQIGPQGIQGDEGPEGPEGPVGPEGPEGPVGPEGPQGPQGDTGPPGTYTAGNGISLDEGEINNIGDTNANDDITNTTSAGGDLSGTYPSPTVSRIKGIPVVGTPSEGDVIKYFSQTNQFVYADDEDTNDWTGIPGGISYSNVAVKNNEVYLNGTNNGSIQGNSTSIIFQFDDVSRVGLYDGSDEWGPNSNNNIRLGSSAFRYSEIWSVNGLNQSSDRRLKKEIKPLAYGLQSVMQMEPVSYKWREGNQDVLIGFIAQDMEEVIPEVVQQETLSQSKRSALEAEGRIPGEDMYSMNYSEIIPVLVKAIQEQQEQIEELKSKIKALED